MLLGFFMAYKNYRFAQTGIKTTGRITSITISRSGDDTTHNVIIAYKIANGREYQTRGNFYYTGMKVGDTVAMRYNPQNVEEARMVSGDIFSSVFWLCFGLIFVLAGFVPVRKYRQRKKDAAILFKSGSKVEAVVEKIYQNTSLKVNGKSPYRISAISIDADGSQKSGTYISCDLWFDPGFYIKKGDSIDVYVSPQNPGKYFVDISDLYLLSKKK